MVDGSNRSFEPLDGAAPVENLASVGTRVQRKKEQGRRERKKHRQQTGIEETLQEEKEQLENQSSQEDGHIDFHA